MSLRLKAFSCPATSESSNTLSPAGLRKDLDPQQPTPSRYDVCEMSGLVMDASCKYIDLPVRSGRNRLRLCRVEKPLLHPEGFVGAGIGPRSSAAALLS